MQKPQERTSTEGAAVSARVAVHVSLGVALMAAACGPVFREARLSEPARATAGDLRVEVQRVRLTDDMIENGVGDDAALIVELTASNTGSQAYRVEASSLWCLMAIDATRPDQTLLLPPSASGEGQFPGRAPEDATLQPLEVPAGQTRSFWVLFRGYRFSGSDVPRRITLTLPGADGRRLELVLADPARGLLRWDLTPRNSAWMVGFQDESLFGSYVRATGASTEIARISRVGSLLWEVGVTTGLLVETPGALRSPTSSFETFGLEAHLTAPIWKWGPPFDPRRLGLYAGAETRILIALEPPRSLDDKSVPPHYGAFDPEVGIELDIGALRDAATPFPLSNAGRNPLPRWLLRYGYTHAWIGHGTSDGLVSSFRLVW
jgi:hypothetical protein